MSGRRSGALSGSLIGLGSLLVAAAAAVGAVVALPADPPAALRTASPVETVAVTERTDADEHQVQLALDTGAPRSVVTSRTGIVTSSSCSTGGVLRSGTEIARVDDVPVIAFASGTPLFRDLRVDDRGEDVRGLQQELVRLGSAIAVDGIVGPGTLRTARSFLLSHGVPRVAVPDDTIERSAFAWIPAAEATVRTCTAVVGAPVDAEGALVELPAELRGARIEQLPPEAVAGAREIAVGQLRTAVDDNGVVSDLDALAQIGALPEYAATVASADGVPTLPATWALAEPLEVHVVPPSALWDVRDHHACVQPVTGDPVRVEVIGSELGQSFIRADPGEEVDPTTSDPATPDPVTSDPAMPDPAMPDPASLDRVRAVPDTGRSCR
jgi:peptidoglycan hydrolase-like protein with peptidoglycan-binding domain